MTLAPLIAAGLAGLAGSPHCVGMCGPFAAAASRTGAGGVAWHAGRLVTYATLGALAGALGSAMPGPTWLVRGLGALLLIGFSARLAGFIPEFHLASVPGLQRALTRAARLEGPLGSGVFGALAGLMPCGLVYAALAVPIAAAEPTVGAVSMVAFGLGTIPLLALLSGTVQGLIRKSKAARYALAATVLVTGLASISTRAPAPPGEAPHCHEE
ncbi:MAG: sulfite exporter TauE/SafE family protein [Proteobacteria bacterium]|nr:sulfite exporter TauE/SafE family protein [Pseudomonadota bacterium]